MLAIIPIRRRIAQNTGMRKIKTAEWMSAAFLAALILVVVNYSAAPPDPFPRFQLIVFSIGVEYIAFALAFEFGGRILDGNLANTLDYFPLFAAAVGGRLLRIGASIKRRSVRENTQGCFQID